MIDPLDQLRGDLFILIVATANRGCGKFRFHLLKADTFDAIGGIALKVEHGITIHLQGERRIGIQLEAVNAWPEIQHHIVARPQQERVSSTASFEHIVPLASVQDIVSATTIQNVITPATTELIRTSTAIEGINALSAVEIVVATATIKGIVSSTTVDVVITFAGFHHIGRIRANQLIIQIFQPELSRPGLWLN